MPRKKIRKTNGNSATTKFRGMNLLVGGGDFGLPESGKEVGILLDKTGSTFPPGYRVLKKPVPRKNPGGGGSVNLDSIPENSEGAEPQISIIVRALSL